MRLRWEPCEWACNTCPPLSCACQAPRWHVFTTGGGSHSRRKGRYDSFDNGVSRRCEVFFFSCSSCSLMPLTFSFSRHSNQSNKHCTIPKFQGWSRIDTMIERLKFPSPSMYWNYNHDSFPVADLLLRPTVEARAAQVTAAQRKAEEIRVQVRKQHQASLKRGKYEKHSIEIEQVCIVSPTAIETRLTCPSICSVPEASWSLYSRGWSDPCQSQESCRHKVVSCVTVLLCLWTGIFGFNAFEMLLGEKENFHYLFGSSIMYQSHRAIYSLTLVVACRTTDGEQNT